MVRRLASRLSSKEILAQAIDATRVQTAFPRSVQWIPYSVAQGYAGLALFWAQMDACFPGEGWDLRGRDHLALAARDLERSEQPPLGIFAGVAGVAFAAWGLSRGGTRYQRLLTVLDNSIIQRTVHLANRLKDADGCSVSDFDVISGLAGIGAYLLCRSDDRACVDCLYVVLQTLVGLLNGREDLPKWHTPGRLIGDEQTRDLYPGGWLNCGLAHGGPGPLALLSLAHSKGITVAELPEAIVRTADWLCDYRIDDRFGINWPTAVPLVYAEGEARQAIDHARAATAGPSRCAWCYGSPGVGRALWLAGEAIDCQRYRDLGISALEAVFRRPVADRSIDSPTFCHGVAGLLQVTLRFANDLQNDNFRSAADALVGQLLASYSSDFLLGWRNLEIDSHATDQPGFLDGAPGVAAVLLAAATNSTPTWDRIFLLS
jgi:hypothetical protein